MMDCRPGAHLAWSSLVLAASLAVLAGEATAQQRVAVTSLVLTEELPAETGGQIVDALRAGMAESVESVTGPDELEMKMP